MESVDGSYFTRLSIPARADFHETRTTALLYKTLIYRNTWKSDKRFGRMY